MAENQAKSEVAKREEEILAFWNEHQIFKKSLKKDAPKGEYVFYDGPPFATGTPHYGHIVASVIKDVVPRYFTMQGYRVPRQWGWDCHGLPIENIVEKELGTKHKKDILALGVAKFNELCRSKVLMYVDEWKKVIPRIGRWADMDDPYFTMSRDFMESVWWAFKELYDKGLIYEDYRSMHICPRCETTLSQSEVAEGYKDVKDLAVTVKFKLKNPEKIGLSGDVYMLAWTTTPWTLPGNVALAVNGDVKYWAYTFKEGEHKTETYIFAEQRATEVLKNQLVKVENAEPKEMAVSKIFTGNELIGLEYEPPFDYYSKNPNLKDRENGWKVYAADFVTAESGTGIAHEAPAFGADDWALLKRVHLPFVQHVKMDGTFKPEVTDFAGMEVKPIEDPSKADIEIIKYLAHEGLLFAKEKIEHSYPHCWRCDSPLLNYATSSWFVKVEAQKEALLQNAKPINWSPEHIKEGRWGRWLDGARDWSISRQRFWASVIPIWRCEQCETVRVFGFASELEQASGKNIDDLHKHIVDEITLPCECGGVLRRVPDVLDTWFDSGSMPYGQAHYPFEHKERFDKTFPAQFIAEGQDQTRAWFYYLHVLATSIFGKNAFENVIVNGIVLAEDGKKMSKRLQNYPDPMAVVDTYGADALRLYLLASPVMRAENLNFSEKGVAEWKGILTRLENVFNFYEMYKGEAQVKTVSDPQGMMDRWIVARLQQTIGEVTRCMNAYDLTAATRPLGDFINDLSMWYLRRSRERIKNAEPGDRSVGVLKFILMETAKMIAPFAPFQAESLWQRLGLSGDLESVHLASWANGLAQETPDKSVLAHMEKAREFVSIALEQRESAGVKVRQPLTELKIPESTELPEEFLSIIAEEVNVKRVVAEGTEIVLDIQPTEELRHEGVVRDIMRAVQQKRKELGLRPHEFASVTVRGVESIIAALRTHEESFKKATKTTELHMETDDSLDSNEKLLIEVRKLQSQITRTQQLSIVLALAGAFIALIYGLFFK